ncbi:MAG: conjugal transfer protein TraF (plasmid) [Candidatus Symbiodolus clandestinus]
MFKKIVGVTVISLTIHNVFSANYSDARNIAMGGVGVATSRGHGALLSNPALLATEEKYQLTLPTVGIQLSDKHHLIDDLKSIKSKVDKYDENRFNDVNAAKTLAGELASILETIKNQNKAAYLNIGAAASMIFPGPENTYRIGFLVKSQADVAVHPTITEGDLRLASGIASGNIPPINFESTISSEARGLAVWMTDFGLSLARSFEIKDKRLQVGITPKMQMIKTFNYAVNINQYKTKDFKLNQYLSQHNKFNLDLGIAAELTEQLTVGLVGKNLLKNNLETKAIHDKSFTYQIAPVFSTGAAYRWKQLTAALDVDITPTKAFSNQKDSQYVGFGAEWEASHWAKLRAGYRMDTKHSKPNIVTAGIGFHTGSVFKLDMAGMFSAKNNLGAVLQMSYTF